MSAFNRRYEPRELFGVPVITAVAVVAALPLLLCTLLLPEAVRPVTGMLMLAALAVAGAGLWLGDELPFMTLMFAACRERGRVTSETWTDD